MNMAQDTRQADALIEGGVVGAGEGLAERLERLNSKLMKISEEWDNLPSSDEMFSLDSYLNGRIALLVEVNISGHPYCIAAYARPTKGANASIVGFQDGVLRQLGDAECGHEQVVLLPVAEVVESAKKPAAPVREILVRFYRVTKEFNDLIDHPTIGYRFKNISNGRFRVFPVGFEGDITRALGLWVQRAFYPHIAKVQTGSQVVAGVPREAGDGEGHRLSDARAKHIASHLRIGVEGDLIRLSLDEGVDLGVEVLDQFVGPYDLKGRVPK